MADRIAQFAAEREATEHEQVLAAVIRVLDIDNTTSTPLEKENPRTRGTFHHGAICMTRPHPWLTPIPTGSTLLPKSWQTSVPTGGTMPLYNLADACPNLRHTAA